MKDEWREPWDWWCRRQVGIAGVMGATLGRGIAPDVHIPWTPAQLARDVELETACEQVAGWSYRRLGAKMSARLRFNVGQASIVSVQHDVLPGK